MFQKLLAVIASKLDDLGIPYMVIGGQAVLLYGEPRLTKDIDVTLGIGAEGLLGMQDVIHEVPLSVLVENPDHFVRDTMVLPTRHEESGIRVDFIFSHSVYEREAIERAKPITLRETPVRFATLEDVVIHKIIAGRPRDLEDVRKILLKNPDFDLSYIKQWLESFDQSLEENFSQVFYRIVGEKACRP